ncbi:hypothetical protein [Ochrobactrum sp. BTU1]|uniref:hypothetical protein n=1 Tax=Ochrobactrum sp. BTU1 TaxID=2840456 RepID=UPI001C0485C6|nr:hypothetical protein KMS41_14130 [Ochrobactrum sp. BTU1]
MVFFLKNLLKGMSTRAKWSTLTRVGNSYIVRLTIVAPFVGGLLIFNQNVIDVLDFSTVFLDAVGIANGTSGISSYALAKLYYIYFGLFFLGVGSILYSLYCPEKIAKFPFSDDYNRSRLGLNSPTLCISSFETIAEAYARDADVLEWRSKTFRDGLAYSDELGQLTYSLLMRIYGDHEWEQNEPEAHDFVAPRTDDIEDDGVYRLGTVSTHYVMPNGYISVDNMAKDIVSAPRIMWRITIPLKEGSFKFQSDVYHLSYMVDDLSLPTQRLLCIFAYLFGFIILLIPSIETFLRISVNLFN